MSLRARFLVAIFFLLLPSLGVGTSWAIWQARRSVRTELISALASAQGNASVAIAVASRSGGRLDDEELHRIVAGFDGNRHIAVQLRDSALRVLAVSHLAAAGKPPEWFLTTMSPILAPVVLKAGIYQLVLVPDATNESYERWNGIREAVMLLAIFFVLTGVLCGLVAVRALTPLTDLSKGLARLQKGDRNVHVEATGLPEIAALGASFNALSASLHSAETRNLQLQAQSTMLVEEERAEIARNLHDEVGPLLFAITTFTATVGKLVAEERIADILPQLLSIQEATSAIQIVVRDMLGRLDDVIPHSVDLADALDRLIAFWRRVQPNLTFTLDTDFDSSILTRPLSETLFRVAQEGMSNAVRHAQPRCVQVRVEQWQNWIALSVSDDGGGGPEIAGFGLRGMRARVAAVGGRLDILRDRGWTVRAVLPLPRLGATLREEEEEGLT